MFAHTMHQMSSTTSIPYFLINVESWGSVKFRKGRPGSG